MFDLNATVLLALISALSHAIFAAMQKSKEDPFFVRAGIDLWFFIIFLPIVAFVVPCPNGHEWLLISGIFPIHTIYKLVLTAAYRNGDFNIIYPLARGSAPLFTALAAIIVFDENLEPLQWLGLMLISTMIMGLSIEALRVTKIDRQKLPRAIGFALATGFMIMVYLIYDAYGVRNARSPFIFLAWFYIVDGFLFPLVVVLLRHRIKPKTSYRAVITRGAMIAPFGIISFAAAFYATAIGKVAEVSAIRETSTVFATLIAYFILREPMTKLRFVFVILIAIGAILIEIGR